MSEAADGGSHPAAEIVAISLRKILKLLSNNKKQPQLHDDIKTFLENIKQLIPAKGSGEVVSATPASPSASAYASSPTGSHATTHGVHGTNPPYAVKEGQPLETTSTAQGEAVSSSVFASEASGITALTLDKVGSTSSFNNAEPLSRTSSSQISPGGGGEGSGGGPRSASVGGGSGSLELLPSLRVASSAKAHFEPEDLVVASSEFSNGAISRSIEEGTSADLSSVGRQSAADEVAGGLRPTAPPSPSPPIPPPPLPPLTIHHRPGSSGGALLSSGVSALDAVSAAATAALMPDIVPRTATALPDEVRRASIASYTLLLICGG